MSNLSPDLLNKLRLTAASLLDIARQYVSEHPNCTDEDVTQCIALACQLAVKDYSREDLEQIAARHVAQIFQLSAERMSKFLDTLQSLQAGLNKPQTPTPEK